MASSTPSDPLSEIEGYLVVGVFVAALAAAGWFLLPLLLPIIRTAAAHAEEGREVPDSEDDEAEAEEDEEEAEEDSEARVP